MKKLKPKINKDLVWNVHYSDGQKMVSTEILVSRHIKDNSIWGRNGGACACGWVTRVPSIKRSNRVWRNFYKLFPKISYMVQTMKDKAVDGILTLTSDEFGSTSNKMGKVDGFGKPSHLGKRTFKFKIV